MKKIIITIECNEYEVADSLRDFADFIESSDIEYDQIKKFEGDTYKGELNVVETKCTYYQPVEYMDDGTNIEWGDIPSELYSFEVFPTREEAVMWLENNGYDSGDFSIMEYHDDDIEDYTLIDCDGNLL